MTTLDERFWSNVAKSGDCWEWEGTRRRDGYGVFWTGERQVRAHRFAWERERGPIPEGLSLCHSCDNPPCVRPDHLFVGTQRDNLEDMTRKGRRMSRLPEQDQRGSKNRAAKLTEGQVGLIKGLVGAGHYHDDVAAQFGISRSSVSRIVTTGWPEVPPAEGPFPTAVRNRPVGRSAPRKRAEMT